MDILLLVFLSIRLAGKFKTANTRGAAKYILGMVGAVVASELVGLLMVNAAESLFGLLVCMGVGVALVILIYRAGAKKTKMSIADAGELRLVNEAALVEPKTMRPSALVCAFGLMLTGTFGLFLGYTMSSLPSSRSFTMSIMGLLSTRNPQIACFLLLGIGMLVLCAGYFMMASVRGLGKSAKTASVFCGAATLIYALYLLYSAFSYRDIYIRVRSMSMAVPVYIPIILTIIVLAAFCLHLASLGRQLNKPGYVFAVISMFVLGIVGLFEIYTFFAFATGLPARTALFGTWYRAPVVGFGLSAVTMIFLAFGRITETEIIPETTIPQTPAYRPKGNSVFEPFTGNGVCDVCNAPVNGRKAFVVPNNTFYNSPKYRKHYRQIQRNIIGMDVPDSIFTQMQAADKSPGSAVCENCVHMFE